MGLIAQIVPFEKPFIFDFIIPYFGAFQILHCCFFDYGLVFYSSILFMLFSNGCKWKWQQLSPVGSMVNF
jgi:hypothetical protein